MEQNIIKKIGDNHTDEIPLVKVVIDEPGLNELVGFYTYKSEVFILDGFDMDVPFADYSDKNKVIIYNAIMKL